MDQEEISARLDIGFDFLFLDTFQIFQPKIIQFIRDGL
jgi:hypothetical protein